MIRRLRTGPPAAPPTRPAAGRALSFPAIAEGPPAIVRATAATFHAGRGLEMHALMQHFGWAQASTAEVYLARNSQSTARQLDAVHQG